MSKIRVLLASAIDETPAVAPRWSIISYQNIYREAIKRIVISIRSSYNHVVAIRRDSYHLWPYPVSERYHGYSQYVLSSHHPHLATDNT